MISIQTKQIKPLTEYTPIQQQDNYTHLLSGPRLVALIGRIDQCLLTVQVSFSLCLDACLALVCNACVIWARECNILMRVLYWRVRAPVPRCVCVRVTSCIRVHMCTSIALIDSSLIHKLLLIALGFGELIGQSMSLFPPHSPSSLFGLHQGCSNYAA